jgi:ATP-binding cassette subfamily B protein
MTPRLSRKFLSWLYHHAFEFKWFYLGAFFCLYILQVLQAELPERIRSLTNLMTLGDYGKVSIWIFLGLAVGILIFRTFSRLLFFYPARVQQKLLRMELLEMLEKVPPERYQARSQGQVFQVLFDDINNIRAFIGFGLLQIGNLIIAAIVLIPKINQTDSYLWPAFIPLFSSILLFSLITFINEKFFKKMVDKKGEVQQYIIESYEAKQTIKNFHREESFLKGFIQLSAQEMSYFYKIAVGSAISSPYIKLGLGASLLWGGVLVKARGGSPSDLVFFSGFLYLFLEPVMFLSWVAVVLSQGLAAWRRAKELFQQISSPAKIENEVEFNSFEESEVHVQQTLNFWDKKIELIFPKKRWTVMIGETGVGKTFLLSSLATNLILRNKKVSMVQQEPYLFNDTIFENIFLGQQVDEEQKNVAKKLLEIFQLDSLASDLDEVLALEVGENGKRLSGGQIKRVALIRSLLSGAEILIWDDPFSSVDIILEKRIMKSLRNSLDWSSKTFFISSHRLTTVRLSDELIFIDRDEGIKTQGKVDFKLKEENVVRFFKEQFVETSLA